MSELVYMYFIHVYLEHIYNHYNIYRFEKKRNAYVDSATYVSSYGSQSLQYKYWNNIIKSYAYRITEEDC